MDDKRTAIAVLLCIMVIMMYQRLIFSPNRYPQQVSQTSETTKTNPSNQSFNDTYVPKEGNSSQQTNNPNPGQTAPSANHPSPADIAKSAATIVETDLFTAKLIHLGGRLSSFKLKKYSKETGDSEPLDLIAQPEGTSLPLGLYAGEVNDEFVTYERELPTGNSNETLTVSGATGSTIVLRGVLPDGNAIRKIIKVNPSSYLLDVSVELVNPSKSGARVWLEWSYFLTNDDLHQSYNPRHYSLLGSDGKVKQVQANSVTEALTPYGENKWISFGDKYFIAALLPTAQGMNSLLGQQQNLFVQRAGGTDRGGNFHIYLGPRSHSILASTGYELERSVDLGWFSFIAHPLLWLLKFFYSILGNWGLAIIVLTLCVKTAFLPLTSASFKSMKAMQDLQPEMKALRERVQDPTKLNQELMELYKRRGVNPMGGCLPILIQLPVFLGLYNALSYAIELRHAPFALWIQDLSTPERLNVLGIGVPVMILIMGVTMFIQQYTTPSAMDPAQRKAMLLTPIIFTVMFVIFPFPAGLVLYWLVNNLISIVQQISLRSENGSPLKGTILANIGIFAGAYLLTLI